MNKNKKFGFGLRNIYKVNYQKSIKELPSMRKHPKRSE